MNEFDSIVLLNACTFVKEGAASKKFYTDHNTMIKQINLLIRSSEKQLPEMTVTTKKYRRYDDMIQEMKINSIIEKGYLQESYLT